MYPLRVRYAPLVVPPLHPPYRTMIRYAGRSALIHAQTEAWECILGGWVDISSCPAVLLPCCCLLCECEGKSSAICITYGFDHEQYCVVDTVNGRSWSRESSPLILIAASKDILTETSGTCYAP